MFKFSMNTYNYHRVCVCVCDTRAKYAMPAELGL